MVAMPYLLLATVGFFVYRGLRRAQPSAEPPAADAHGSDTSRNTNGSDISTSDAGTR
jgi:hypothetical protein